MTANERRCDVLIVGGGLVGSALACALSDLPLDTLLVEAHEARELTQPSFDERVTALASGSQRILAALGLWRPLQGQAEAIRVIHISEQGRFGAARIRAEEEGLPALGYTIENRAIGRVLWEALQGKPRFEVLAPAQMTDVETSAARVVAQVEAKGKAQDATVTVHAKLLVAADGQRSWVRHTLGGAVREDDYEQAAIILNCRTEAAPDGRAFERFTPRGPIAFLPLTGNRVAVIWTLPAADAGAAMQLSDDDIRAELQAAFGYKLGRITQVGARHMHPLARVVSEPLDDPRVVLIGNAALSLHPVAGQGFNLALRDVATLAEVIADELREGSADVGSDAILARYRQWRSDDQRRVSRFTHGLIRLFGAPAAGLAVGRGLGLMVFDLVPGAKTLLARQTTGRAGRLPRLARGLPLN